MELGSIEIIVGPMYCGKTGETIRRLCCDVAVGKEVLFINHSIDNRSSNSFSTHHPLYKDSIPLSSIMYTQSLSILPSLDKIKPYHTIGIDEGQFLKI